MGKAIKIGEDEYEVIPGQAVAASKMLADAWEKAGKPDDPFSTQGKQIIMVIIAIWRDLYPGDAYEWFEMRKEHLNEEMSIREQVSKQTGRSLASIPLPVYRMMRKVFPEFKLNTREESIKFVKEFPIFRMVNTI